MYLIYIDLPFATGTNFSVKIKAGDVEWTKVSTENTFWRRTLSILRRGFCLHLDKSNS